MLLALLVLAALDILLMASGRRILIGEEYVPEHDGSMGGAGYVAPSEAKFECTYFTGRRQVLESLSSYQFDECPFIWSVN